MSHSAASADSDRLRLTFFLVIGFMVVEVVAGLLTGSLALISDAAHMGTDALGLGMALAAILVARKGTHAGQRTFGLYRLEILAALANVVLLIALAAFVIYEAVRRWTDPAEILTGPMLIVAVIGLAVNLIGIRLLGGSSLNMEAARSEVWADLVGSIGVLIAALIIRFTGWLQADPLIAAAIGVLIVPRAWRIGREALRILVQAAPPGMDLAQIKSKLAALPGVVDIHDLHVWTLTSGMEVASAHLMIGNDRDPHVTLDGARDLLQRDYAISHATLQVEPESHEGCTELTW
jgi:cobalt-zinc-cadmium efflux system protein